MQESGVLYSDKQIGKKHILCENIKFKQLMKCQNFKQNIQYLKHSWKFMEQNKMKYNRHLFEHVLTICHFGAFIYMEHQGFYFALIIKNYVFHFLLHENLYYLILNLTICSYMWCKVNLVLSANDNSLHCCVICSKPILPVLLLYSFQLQEDHYLVCQSL